MEAGVGTRGEGTMGQPGRRERWREHSRHYKGIMVRANLSPTLGFQSHPKAPAHIN